MSKVTSSNYSAPNAATYHNADTDQYSRADSFTNFLVDLDAHDHTNTKGLGVGRIQSANVPANTGEVQVVAGGIYVYDGSAVQHLVVPTFVSFTPTMAQSASLTITVNYAKYWLLGKLYVCQMDISIGSSGTSTNTIEIDGLPAAITNGESLQFDSYGVYLTSGGTPYGVIGRRATATSVSLFSTSANAGLGASVTAANGDRCYLQMVGLTA